jgi:hypothetical protein
MLGIIMLSVIIESYYNGCHSANYRHPGCHYDKCYGTFPPPPSKSLQFCSEIYQICCFCKIFLSRLDNKDSYFENLQKISCV